MKKVEINILPLLISTVLVLISFGIINTSNYIFTTKHYIGMTCFLVSIILYFANRRIYFLFFALTLTIGLLGFLDFYYSTFKVGFAGVGINPIFVGLLILFFVVSRTQIDRLAPERKVIKERTLDENLVRSYESKLKGKTVGELRTIADKASKYTEEARTAAVRLLEKKA